MAETVPAWRSGSPSRLPRGVRHALWAFLLLAHALCAVYLLLSAKLYWLLENEYLNYFAGLLAPERDHHFRVVGAAMGVLGATHGLQLCLHLGVSAIARSPTVQPLKLGSICATVITLGMEKLASAVRWVLHRWRSSRTGRPKPVPTQSLTRDNNLNDGAYGRMFALRKIMEIATQVPNGYLYSTLIARSWINHTKVALLVIKCWSSFVIHRSVLKNSAASKSTALNASVHLAAVVVDTLLATCTAIVLPGAIFIPYALQFDYKDLTFPDATLYGDTAFVNLVLENRAVFFMSWPNAAMKSVPHVSLVLCLEAIAGVLSAPQRLGPDKSAASPPTQPPEIGVGTTKPIAPDNTLIHDSERALGLVPRLNRVHRVLIPLVFLVTGGIVLVVHLTAQYGLVTGDVEAMEGMCLQRMHPWFASNFSCAVVKYNCYKEGVSSPAAETLGWLERESVRKLIFMHCPAFVMPTLLREFPSLMGVELWNVTLERWGEEAALSAALHPTMLYVNFAYVNMTGVPAGILQSPLPELLIDLEFTHTNLTALPQEIVEPWKGVEILFIEHSQINPFPSVLMELQVLSEFSLIANKFEAIPDDALLNAASVYFYNLALSHNALRALPAVRSENFDVSYLALEFTLLTELPAWVSTQVWESVSLGGSPVCDQRSNHSHFPDIAVCGDSPGAWNPLGEARYPTQLMKPFRALDG
jgi:hypothetical protein